MLRTSDNIEQSTMNYVFDMFGKSVTQMLQASINQQMEIDELRAQLRSCQTQITNIFGTLEDFEDRVLIRLQDSRPTIYTRDGIPFDDALDQLRKKIDSTNDRQTNQEEIIKKLEDEVNSKLDIDQFHASSKTADEMTETILNVNSQIQSMQRELSKQREGNESMMEKCAEIVKLEIQRYASQMDLEKDINNDNGGYVTNDKFMTMLNNLKAAIGLGNVDLLDPNISNSLQEMKGRSVGAGKEARRGNLDDDDYEISDIFAVTLEKKEIEMRDIGLLAEGGLFEDQIDVCDNHYHVPTTCGFRRHFGLTCDFCGFDENGNIIRSKGLFDDDSDEDQTGRRGAKFDENKMVSSITSMVMNKIEPLLVDLFTNVGIGGIKLDKNDAKQLVSQLTALTQVQDDIDKMKLLISLKFDRAEAENELAIRITRDEFFKMLISIFPNNAALQKAYANYKKKLPPLRSPESEQRSRSKNDDFDERTIHQRNIKTAIPPTMLPARNSRLLALNQKFLKGADGKYYLRDISTLDNSHPNILSATSKIINVTAEQAFDYQPFLPASSMRESDKLQIPIQYRAKTPPDPSD